MKSKIIIIAVAVVCITGASFATGVAIEKHNIRETSMLVDEAVSSAVSDAFNSTTTIETIIVSTTEKSTVSEPAATTVQTTTETSTTKAKKTNTTKKKTTTTIKTTTNKVETVNDYGYYLNPYKKAIIDGKETMVYVIKGNGPDVGKYCYKDDNNKTIYIDDISTIEFVE